MREDNLLAIRKRRFVPQTTDSGHDFEVALNVARRLIPINQLWVADITYVRLAQVDVFLAVVMDAYSRRIVGWNLAPKMTTELALTALRNAIESRQPAPGLIHHSESRSPVCVNRVRRHAASARHDAEHEQAGQSLRQCEMRTFHENSEAGRDSLFRVPGHRGSAHQYRGVHRLLLQRQASTLGTGLPVAGRV
jgi:hypothetical protein